jgi:5-methylcytosine-specific restriction endonuclease McrA
MSMMKQPVLMLNASYEPIRIVLGRRAIKLIIKGVAEIEIDRGVEAHRGIRMPSVIRLKNYHKIPTRMPIVSRRNILVRDNYTCCYCGHKFKSETLTLDHVTPRSKGGRSVWENLVACCGPCNRKKSDRSPQDANMPLLRKPLPATVHTSRFVLRSVGGSVSEWDRFLWHDNLGDQRLQFN